MIIFSILVATAILFGALVCYASCCAASRADRQSEEWFRLKMQEKDVEKYNDNR